MLLDPFGVVAGHAAKDVAKELHLPDVESVTYNPLDFIRERQRARADGHQRSSGRVPDASGREQ